METATGNTTTTVAATTTASSSNTLSSITGATTPTVVSAVKLISSSNTCVNLSSTSSSSTLSPSTLSVAAMATAAASVSATATTAPTPTTSSSLNATMASVNPNSNTINSNIDSNIPASPILSLSCGLATTPLTAIVNLSNPCSSTSLSVNTTTSSGVTSNPSSGPMSSLNQPVLSHNTTLDSFKEEPNNLSVASAASESQRSLSGAPSSSSSPILSPQGKIYGRNANGTMVATSRPGNEAEIQLYRVLQRASLLAYYDTLVEMGGDDVAQLYDAGEEEFLEIMALVGMASKPLHVRRLQKALHEWANNPQQFQSPIIPGFCETPTKASSFLSSEPSPSIARPKFNPHPLVSPSSFQPTPLINTNRPSANPIFSQICPNAIPLPVFQPQTSIALPNVLSTTPLSAQPSGNTPSHQVSSSSPQLTPVLTELQVNRITIGAETIARQLPQREPRAQTSKKRTSRELEQVMAMNENDPRRMDEIRKYSAIYGRFDCKRRPEKPLTLHEVCVNEAAAQLCRLVPALLTRRDELFPLARQVVKDAGFGHSASIARYGNLLNQNQASTSQRSSNAPDSDTNDMSTPSKRQRLTSTDNSDSNRDLPEESRYNLFAMYQKFAKPPFDLSEIAKFSLGKSDLDDNDSQFSFGNSNSPPMPLNGLGNDGGNGGNDAITSFDSTRRRNDDEAHSTSSISTSSDRPNDALNNNSKVSDCVANYNLNLNSNSNSNPLEVLSSQSSSTSPINDVQVISSAGGNIIAVANPALAMSPTLNDTTLSLKRSKRLPED